MKTVYLMKYIWMSHSLGKHVDTAAVSEEHMNTARCSNTDRLEIICNRNIHTQQLYNDHENL